MTDSYPHELAGDPAPPPEAVPPRVLGMALKAHRKHLEGLPGLRGAGGWPTNPRPAASLVVLRGEVNAAAPGRNKRSDGLLGDAGHAAAGAGSDHNPWVKVAGVGVVRAFDITADPVLNLPMAFEKCRAYAAAGWAPQLLDGGYLILNGRITAADWSGWRVYTGPNPHVAHGHVSVSRTAFDDPRPWLIFTDNPWPPEHPPSPTPAPAAPPAPVPPGWTGPDLAGAGAGLRGDVGNNGPRVAALQDWLNRMYPAYSRLTVDGWWGPATSAVLDEFGRRSGIPQADGLNIGPKLADALHRAGFERRIGSSARDRVLGHVGRRARR